MGFLTFLIVSRIKRIFDFKNHPFRTISIVLSLFMSIFYGYLFANLYNSTYFQENVLSKNEFEHYFMLFLLIITFLRGFFPTYTPIKNVIANNFPFKKIDRFLSNTVNEFIIPFYFGIVFFVFTFSIKINSGGLVFLLVTTSWIVASHFLKRMIQLFIDFKLQSLRVFLILLPFFTFFLIAFLELIEQFYYFISFSISGILIITNYFLEYGIKEARVVKDVNIENNSNMFYFSKLLINNKLLRTMALLTVIVKTLLVFAAWSVYQKKGHYFSESEFFVYIFISPVILFSYFFNNFFGFLPTIWLSIRKVGGNIITYSQEMSKVILIPLIIDATLTSVFLVISNKMTFSYIVFYFSNIFVLFPIGVLNSFLFSKQVKSFFSLGGTTSILANIISISVVMLLIVLTKYSPSASLVFSVITAFILYFLSKDKIYNTHYKVFQKLFKQNG